MTWTLASAESRAAEHASFKIPSRAEREGLRVGDFAKLIFIESVEGGPLHGERMWVEIARVEGTHYRYRGLLRNTPVQIQDLDAGASIEFGPEHVADLEVA